jgi:hypothetical protein
MMRSRRWQRRRASYEKLATQVRRFERRKPSGQTRKRSYEVRRRNGHRKVARTLADRILVLTKAGQGNLDGFVAFCAFARAFVFRLSFALPVVAQRCRPVECAISGETPWIAQLSCGCSAQGYCKRKRVAAMMRARRLQVDCEQREARRNGSDHRRRQPHGYDTAETTFVALLAARSARTRADRFSCITKPLGISPAASLLRSLPQVAADRS